MKSNLPGFNRIRRKVDKFDFQAKFSWAVELFACAVVGTITLVAWLFLLSIKELNLLFQLGMFTMVASSIFVAGKIIVSRRVSTIDDWTLAAKINIQIEKREKEIKLLNSVASWYLSPIIVAVFLVSYGGHIQGNDSYIPNTELLVYWGLCMILYIGIYFLNKYSAKNKVQPILDQLYALRRELEG